MTQNERTEQQAEGLIAASLAHEIRNPLALIKANLQFVELADKKGKFKKNYEIINREIDRINELLRCYLDCGASVRVIPVRFKLCGLINEIAKIFERPLADSGIKLDIFNEDINLEINADYDKMKQVLINVIQNAKESIEQKNRKTNENSGHIEIKALKDGLLANIIITDNGVGISENDLKLAGTPFFTNKDNGCGLGVSISKEIMELHRGGLILTGKEDRGACVLITIPLPID